MTYVPGGDVWKAKELTLGYVRAQHQTLFNQAMKTQQNLAKKSNNPIIVPILIPTLPNTVDKKANIAILQKIVELPFEVNRFVS